MHIEAELVAYPINRTLLILRFALQLGVRGGVRWRLQFSQRGYFPCLGISHCHQLGTVAMGQAHLSCLEPALTARFVGRSGYRLRRCYCRLLLNGLISLVKRGENIVYKIVVDWDI